MRRDKPARPWYLYALGLVAIVVAVLAILQIGPPSSSARASREVVTAADGVVQSTVTGTGNVEPGSDVDVNFKASGTLQDVFVSVGQHVNQGQLLATLNPTSAQLSLDQAEASMTAAEDQLTDAENGTSSGSSGTSAQDPSSSATDTSLEGDSGSTEFVSDTRKIGSRPPDSTGKTTTTPTQTVTTITTITTEPATGKRSSSTSSSGGASNGSASAGSGSSGARSSGASTTPSPASIASAQASVDSAEAGVDSAKQALADTKLYAPTSGTIVSLASLLAGDSVSAGSSSNASNSSSSSSSSSGTGTSGLASDASSAGSLGGSSSSSSSSTSSSSPFAEIVNAGTMTMTVAFSESDINKVKVGQPATVTLDALPGVELGAHVTQISDVGASSSGVVSYDATLTLDQNDSQVKPGMSASAAVIVGQAQGVTLPNAAVSGTGSLGTVNLMRNGKTVSQQVVVGLRGDSRTQIISGLSSGQEVEVTISLPSLSTSSTSTTGSSTGTLGGTGVGGAARAFGGGGGFFGGGGGGAFFRGGGG